MNIVDDKRIRYKYSRKVVVEYSLYRVAQNKIPHQTICNISAISGLILKILEAV